LALLPGQGKKTTDVGLETIVFALYHHALLGAIAETIPDDHMHVDAGTAPVWAGDMKLACRFGEMLLQNGIFHALLYYVFAGSGPSALANPSTARTSHPFD
jgi:hypothetical protein